MKTVTATEAKNRLGQCLDSARVEPMGITKNRRLAYVVLSHQEYERLTAVEDAHWAARAQAAEAEGYVGADAAAALIKAKMNENT